MSDATRERKLAGWARAARGVLASDEGEYGEMIIQDRFEVFAVRSLMGTRI